jgi:hypothetical protein
MAMPDTLAEIPKLRTPEYPEIVKRGRLSPSQKETLKERQHGLCAGCGIKPKRWEWDHKIEVWEGGRSDTLDNWQGLGSRDDCRCHVEKTGRAAKRRAKMNRLRGKAGQVKRRKDRGGSSITSPGFRPAGDNYVSALSKHHRNYRNRGFGK